MRILLNRTKPVCYVISQLLLTQREAEACNTDDFFKFLRGSTDGFDFILSCFGRGLFPSPLVSSAKAGGLVCDSIRTVAVIH